MKGGPGSERPVSLATAAGVSKALQQLGFEVIEVDVRGPEFVIPEPVDLAFLTIHGTFGEDGQVQRILEERGIAYTGEGIAGSRLAFDKIESKRKFLEHGVPTAAFEVILPGQTPAMELPYVVKAPREGSTVGIYIVKEPSQIEPALKEAAQYDTRLLIEKFVSGRELTVGILGEKALPIIQILPKDGFYDFKNKYPFLNPQAGGGAEHLCPAPLDEALTARIQELALKAHKALGLEVYSRVDFLLTDDNQAFVLEINTIPGMTEASLLPEAAAAAGIGYAELCRQILQLSTAREGGHVHI